MRILSVLMLLMSFQLSAQVNFETSKSWRKVISKAKKSGKMILVSVNEPACERCLEMDSVFKIKEMADFYNPKFHNFKAEDIQDKGQKFFVETFDVTDFPSYLIFDKDGKLVHKRAGGQVVEGMLDFAKGALDPKGQYVYLTDSMNFEQNKNNVEFRRKRLLAIINATPARGDNVEEVNSYFDLIPKKNWSDSISWAIFSYAVHGVKPDIAKYFLSHLDEFAEKNHAGRVYQNADLIVTFSKLDILLGDLTRDEYTEATKGTFYEYKAIEYQFEKLQEEGNWEEYKKLATNVMRKPIYHQDWELLNSLAWNVFESGKTDKSNLNLARQLAQISTQKEANSYNIDTLAQILYFIGRKERAIELQEYAVSLAEDFSMQMEREGVLKKMKSGTLK
ncbi:MAG: hypothetical protein ACJAWV_002596 [Flammeovirgaceae bacterium]|jgi:hypothetical protein